MFLKKFTRVLLTTICVLIAGMWVYAYGFAPRESFNKIYDPLALKAKAKVVKAATDALEDAINLIAADIPSDAKGQELVPAWIADYRLYISDRRAFEVALQSAETRPFFAESEIEGVPVSERISKFARENDMKTCQAPYDLSV